MLLGALLYCYKIPLTKYCPIGWHHHRYLRNEIDAVEMRESKREGAHPQDKAASTTLRKARATRGAKDACAELKQDEELLRFEEERQAIPSTYKGEESDAELPSEAASSRYDEEFLRL